MTKDEEEIIGVNLKPIDKMTIIKTLTLRENNKLLIAIITLYMLFYTRNKQFIVFQITNSHFAYIYSASKQMVEVLHYMSF